MKYPIYPTDEQKAEVLKKLMPHQAEILYAEGKITSQEMKDIEDKFEGSQAGLQEIKNKIQAELVTLFELPLGWESKKLEGVVGVTGPKGPVGPPGPPGADGPDLWHPDGLVSNTKAMNTSFAFALYSGGLNTTHYPIDPASSAGSYSSFWSPEHGSQDDMYSNPGVPAHPDPQVMKQLMESHLMSIPEMPKDMVNEWISALEGEIESEKAWATPEELGETGPPEDMPIPEPLGNYDADSYGKPKHISEYINVEEYLSDKTKLGKAGYMVESEWFMREKENLTSSDKPKNSVLIDSCTGSTAKWEEKGAKLLAPQEYDAKKVFETVKQVISESLSEHDEVLLKQVSDVIAETITEERAAWKQAHNSVSAAFHQHKTEAENWAKQVSKNMAQISVQLHDLTKDLRQAQEEVVRLEAENTKLRVRGSLRKLPRKIKTD